jgi:hypothetical protein
MVKRWFLCYQEYDILAWKHVKGVLNMVPDQFSRLCPIDEEPEPVTASVALSCLCSQESSDHTTVMLNLLTNKSIPQHKWDLIAEAHGTYTGHGGVERTEKQLDRLSHLHKNEAYKWPERKKHVRAFIKMCPCCQKMDTIKKVVHSYPFTTSSYGLWDSVSVDHIEGLRPDENGNTGMIVITDDFSRFIDIYPVKSTDALEVADAFLQFCGRYPTPRTFRTDSGPAFKSHLIKGLIERLGADHFLTSAYSKEQNAIVERSNKEIHRHLRNIIFDKRVISRWSSYVPLVQRIINTSVHSSTGLAPSQIVYANGMELDRSILASGEKSAFLSAFIKDLDEKQSLLIAIAESNLRIKDEAHMSNYAKERTVFEIGSYVLAEHRHNALRRGPKSKLLPFLKGPLLVKTINEMTGMYTVQNLVTSTTTEYHMSRLRPFLYDERTKTPLQVAVTDSTDEFIVERILDMKGNVRKSRKYLTFKVRWAGYQPHDDTWEKWDYVRDSDQLQLFLSNHDNHRVRSLMKKDFIPPELREEEGNEDSDA